MHLSAEQNPDGRIQGHPGTARSVFYIWPQSSDSAQDGGCSPGSGNHESTVSRAASKKYLQCSWGVYPMTFFFSREVHSRGTAPGSQSMTASGVKEALRAVIDGEDKKKPLSDRLLSEKLAERGISISGALWQNTGRRKEFPTPAAGKSIYNFACKHIFFLFAHPINAPAPVRPSAGRKMPVIRTAASHIRHIPYSGVYF